MSKTSNKSISPYPLAEELKRLGEAAFRRQHVNAFLLVKKYPLEGDEKQLDDTVLSPMVDVEDLLDSVKGEPGEAHEPPLPGMLIPLTKTAPNSYTSRIVVGRAKNCDIFIPDSRISKLHCAFIPRSDGQFELVDMGSANGTMINGTRIRPNKPAQLQGGDFIRIHRHEFQFMDTEALLQLLRGLV